MVQKTESNPYRLAIPIAILTSLFTGLAYTVFSIILPWIVESEPTWPLDPEKLGYIMGFMVLLFAGGGLVAAYYADRIYKKPVAIIGGVFTGISCFLTAVSWSYETFVIGIILIGVGNGIISPVIFALIADITKPEKRSTNYGFFLFLGLLGGVFGVIIFIGFLLNGEWRIPYGITGVITIVLSLALIPFNLPKKGGKEHALEEVLQKEGIEYEYRINLKDIPIILKRKSNLILILNFADALPGGIFMFASLWLTQEHGLDKNLAFFFGLIILISRFISPPIWGKVVDKIQQKTGGELTKIKFCLTLLLIYTPLFMWAILIPWNATGIKDLGGLFAMPEFMLFFILLTIGYFISSGTQPVWEAAITEVNFPEHRATSYQFAYFIDQVGVAIGVIFGGILIQNFASGGYTIAFIFAAIAGMVNIVTWIIALRFYKDDKKYIEEILIQRAEELKEKAKKKRKVYSKIVRK